MVGVRSGHNPRGAYRDQRLATNNDDALPIGSAGADLLENDLGAILADAERITSGRVQRVITEVKGKLREGGGELPPPFALFRCIREALYEEQRRWR